MVCELFPRSWEIRETESRFPDRWPHRFFTVADETARENISVVKAVESEPVSNGIHDGCSLAKHSAGKKFAPLLMHFPPNVHGAVAVGKEGVPATVETGRTVVARLQPHGGEAPDVRGERPDAPLHRRKGYRRSFSVLLELVFRIFGLK